MIETPCFVRNYAPLRNNAQLSLFCHLSELIGSGRQKLFISTKLVPFRNPMSHINWALPVFLFPRNTITWDPASNIDTFLLLKENGVHKWKRYKTHGYDEVELLSSQVQVGRVADCDKSNQCIVIALCCSQSLVFLSLCTERNFYSGKAKFTFNSVQNTDNTTSLLSILSTFKLNLSHWWVRAELSMSWV